MLGFGRGVLTGIRACKIAELVRVSTGSRGGRVGSADQTSLDSVAAAIEHDDDPNQSALYLDSKYLDFKVVPRKILFQ
jgi:hypothetical protein